MEYLKVKDSDGIERYIGGHGGLTPEDPFLTGNVMYCKNRYGIYLPIQGTAEGVLLGHNEPHDATNTSVHMTKNDGTTDTLAVAASKGDRTVTVTNGAQWALGDKVKIQNSTAAESEYDILTIKVISGNNITFDRPLDISHDIGKVLTGCIVDMAANIGTPASPQIFSYKPFAGEYVHIHTINITMSSTGEPSLEKFGGIAPLSYGLVMKVTRSSGRDDTFCVPFRKNNAFALSGFSFFKEDKVGTLWYFTMQLDLVQVVNSCILLDGDADEQFDVLVQDDLTGLNAMEIKLNLHTEP